MNTERHAAHHLTYVDLREWIEQVDRLGEIKRLQGITWEREIGMVGAMLQRDDRAPCALFEDIPGVRKGFRVLTNFFGGKRANVTLGFPTTLSKIELSDAFLKVYMNPDNKPIKHAIVGHGPVLDNAYFKDDVDITMFPSPKWHEADGGRYIGTGCYCITQDPDDGWLNQGTYRIMVHDERSVGIYITPGKHGRIHLEKWMARGEPMPIAIVLGGNPMQFLLTGADLPYGVSEYDVLGGLYRKPVECVRGKLTGLPFPTGAEIVLEGWIHPNEVREEGPLGEWTGYYIGEPRPEPVVRVEAVYHRNDPIILGCVHELGQSEYSRYRAIARSALLKASLQAAGIPDVANVWAHEVGGARMLIAVSINQRYAGHSSQAGHVAAQCQVGGYAGRYVVVVDDDIDVSDLNELIWAMLTRSDPATSIDIINNAWSSAIDPRLPPEKRERGDFTMSRAIIDACRPFYWRARFPKVNMPSREVIDETRKRFGWILDERRV
ncbi:MAG: UbiD family decarboxylase [Pirellulales bacterium]|nr:UbiD family decarboxylase [Pirellulales bacterium]